MELVLDVMEMRAYAQYHGAYNRAKTAKEKPDPGPITPIFDRNQLRRLGR